MERDQTVEPTGISDAAAGAGVRSRPASGGAVQWLEDQALFVAVVSVAVVLSLAGASTHLSQDGYLALVAGRIVANHGIPYHDFLTVMAYGVHWVDQQWLAQLIVYRLQQLGGYALFVVVDIGLTALALALAIAASRRLGGSERQVIRVLPLATFFFLITGVVVRTQGFAYPLFVAVLWLLASEARSPTPRRALLVFPILVLWANLHGSVTLGVAFTMIYGAILLNRGVRARGIRGLAHRRGLAFLIGAPLCLLITPYGFSMVGYYDSTILNPQFGQLVSEWRPVTSVMMLAIPFLLLGGVTVWLLGRSGSRTPSFDHWVLGLLALAGVVTVRNITWFGLAAIVLLPATLGQGLGRYQTPLPRRRRLNLGISFTMLAIALIYVMATFGHPASWFESTYPRQAAATVRGILARDPTAKIFADVRFADWLVWHDPALAGRIAYDTSYENLTATQLKSLSTLAEALVPGNPDTVASYSVLVLDPANKTVDKVLLARPGIRVVLRSKKVIVATKPVAAN